MKNKNGFLVISLDFELLWGVFDVVDAEAKKQYFMNTRSLIPEVLSLFFEYNIHATWASVGMLFNKNWEEWKNNVPLRVPGYENEKLSAYNFASEFMKVSDSEMFCFAPELIREINATEGQELGTHTYSHYYCEEPGQDLKSFKADLEKAVEMASKFDIQLRSLVFPRNQVKEEYLKVCQELGIKNVRSNPDSWYWKDARSGSILTKIARTGDAYWPFGRKSYPLSHIQKTEGIPLRQKASRFYRPAESNTMMRHFKLMKIKNEMRLAAKKGEVYHLWWHPHNFGDKPQQSIDDLQKILISYSELNKEYGFRSINMGELEAVIS